MSMAMNGFYATKALRRNQPINFERRDEYNEINERVREDMHACQNDSRVTVSWPTADATLSSTGGGHSSASTETQRSAIL